MEEQQDGFWCKHSHFFWGKEDGKEKRQKSQNKEMDDTQAQRVMHKKFSGTSIYI